MSDNEQKPPFPYNPLPPEQIVKRGVGVALILLLTPLAVAIATLAGCGVAMAGQILAEPYVGKDNPYVIFPLWFGPPLVVLLAMLRWTAIVHRRTHPAGKI